MCVAVGQSYCFDRKKKTASVEAVSQLTIINFYKEINFNIMIFSVLIYHSLEDQNPISVMPTSNGYAVGPLS